MKGFFAGCWTNHIIKYVFEKHNQTPLHISFVNTTVINYLIDTLMDYRCLILGPPEYNSKVFSFWLLSSRSVKYCG